jgi:hypothetical protein
MLSGEDTNSTLATQGSKTSARYPRRYMQPMDTYGLLQSTPGTKLTAFPMLQRCSCVLISACVSQYMPGVL